MKIEDMRYGIMNAPTLEEAKALTAQANAVAEATMLDGRKFYFPDKEDRREAAGLRAHARQMEEAYHRREREEMEMRDIQVPWELHRLLSGIVDVEEAEQGRPCVDARRLWELLETDTRFNDFWKRRVDDCGLRAGKDFYSSLSKTPTDRGGRPQQNYLLTLGAAREVAMITNSGPAKHVRKWCAWRMDLLDQTHREAIAKAAKDTEWREKLAKQQALELAAQSLADALGIYPAQALRRIERDQLGMTHGSADVRKWEPGGTYGEDGRRWKEEEKEHGKLMQARSGR
ncbi:antA/AntB antirepressor family protein [Pseudochelatococcus sp. B33]